MAASGVRVELLGGFRVFVNGRAVTRLPGARQQEVLAFLVFHARGGPVTRQRLAGSVWPDSSDSQSLTNLRRELHQLRDGWPEVEALIDAGPRTIGLADGALPALDVAAFESAAERGLAGDRRALEEAALVYHGDCLPGCSAGWIASDRERLRGRARAVIAQLVGLLEHDRAYADAIAYAQRLCRLDPLDEDAWCALMRCHARRGDRATALHLYQEIAALLKKELGIPPSAATRMTYREILDLDAAAAPVTPAPPASFAYPLVGRHAEWTTLVAGRRAADEGPSRVVLIRGEAGMGKSRLAEELATWCTRESVPALTARCYPGEGRLAYAPVAAWLKHEALEPGLARLEAPLVSDIARLRPEVLAMRSDAPVPGAQLESWQRLRFFDALARVFQAAAPLTLVLDDLQWADPDSLEWLQYFLRSSASRRCLVVGTVRAEEEQDNAALERLLAQLSHDGVLSVIALGPLDSAAAGQLAAAVAEHPLDAEEQARAFRETEGHPLFIIERARMALAGGERRAADRAPSRVQAVVAARLALLSADARATAELASAVGRDFRFDILAQAGDLEEDALVRALDELWRRHVVRVHDDDAWDFTHDRIREVAYAGIGPARARLIHRRIAQAIELLAGSRLDDVCAAIAMHLERGGHPARAIPFLERAADVAVRVSANEEAIRCLTQALGLLDRLLAGPDRDARELRLRATLSVVLNAARGYAAPEVEANLERIIDLSRAAGGGGVPVRWLWVAFTMRFMLGDLKATRAVSEAALAASAADPACRCEAHHAMGGTLCSFGDLEASRRHFEAAIEAYDEDHPQQSALGTDLGVFVHAWYSHTLWLLAEDAAAIAHSRDAIALAARRDHPYSQTLALAYAALLHQMRGDAERVATSAQAVVALCTRYGFAYYGDWARILLGWVRGLTDPAGGVGEIEAALERLDAHRAQARRPYYLSLLAETHLRAGNTTRAVSILDAASAMALARPDVWWLPMILWQRANLLEGPPREAMRSRALDTARAQGSRRLEAQLAAGPA
jgi:DNA-binding SARP family transcriptional activator